MSNNINVVRYSNHKQNGLQTFIGNVLIAFLGTFATFGAFSSYLYKLDVNMLLMGVICFCISVLFVAVYTNRFCKPIVNVLGLACLFIGFGYNYKNVFNGAVYVFDAFKMAAEESGYILLFDSSELITGVDEEKAIFTFCIALICIIGIPVSYFAVKKEQLLSVLAVSVSLSIIGLFVDIEPSMVFFTLVIAFWVCSIKLYNMHHISGYKGNTPAISTYCMVIIFSLLVQVLIPEDKYIRPDALVDMKELVDSKINAIFGGIEENIFDSGEFDEGNLKNGNSGKYDGGTDLYVTLPYTKENVYIKSYVGNNYCDGQWSDKNFKVYSDNSFIQDGVLYQARRTLAYNAKYIDKYFENYGIDDIVKTSITIERTKDTKKKFYVPYGAYTGVADSEIEKKYSDNKYELDYYYVNPDSTMTMHKYYQYMSVALSSKGFFGQEQRYASYVMNNYRGESNDEVREAVLSAIREAGYEKNGIDITDEWKISIVQKYFDYNYEYTLDTNFNSNDDIINQFLGDNRKGYCMHFATAATLMLREMGVPARYAEGYVIKQEDFKNGEVVGNFECNEEKVDIVKVEVSDRRAHAWVEVYFRGYGWTPIEVTPSSAGYQGVEVENPTKDTESTTKATESTTKKTESTTKATETSKKETTKATTKQDDTVATTKAEVSSENVEASGVGNKKDLGRVWLWIGIIAIILIPLMIVCVIHFVKHRRLKRILDVNDSIFNKSRIGCLYNYMNSLLYYMDIDKTPTMSYIEYRDYSMSMCELMEKEDIKIMFDIIIKGYFEEGILPKEEGMILLSKIVELDRCIYRSLNTIQRKVYKYILNLKY